MYLIIVIVWVNHVNMNFIKIVVQKIQLVCFPNGKGF